MCCQQHASYALGMYGRGTLVLHLTAMVEEVLDVANEGLPAKHPGAALHFADWTRSHAANKVIVLHKQL